ncbi:MAG: DUF6221 family protein [Actinophytocola sp.]|uniref:DUF6221 family protein n=1 Tax=Actinophytocola sp. TaxID=1872138 RepID=UPI003C73CAFC
MTNLAAWLLTQFDELENHVMYSGGPDCEYWSKEEMVDDLQAKRQIVEDHADQHTCVVAAAREVPYVGCRTLRLLARPFAGRPGYLDEWRP